MSFYLCCVTEMNALFLVGGADSLELASLPIGLCLLFVYHAKYAGVLESRSTNAVLVCLQVSKTAVCDLLMSLESLVNSQTYSDLMLRTAGEQIVYAHRSLLGARCPRILQVR
jgi:hypothetical protein